MWLAFALLAPISFALVHILDEYCVEEIFEKPWMGMITSSLASIVVVLPLPFIWNAVDWGNPTTSVVVACIIIGIIIQISSGLQFQSLSFSEAGIVSAYWNMIPAFVLVGSFVIYNEVLVAREYIGILALLACSIGFCLLDGNLHSRWKTFVIMLLAAMLETIVFLAEEKLFTLIPFITGFYLITAGIVLAGVFPLVLHRETRLIFVKNKSLLLGAAKFFVLIEIVNLVALGSSQKAIDLGVPSLVSAIEATIPAFTFIISGLLFLLTPKFGNKESLKKAPTKMMLVALMALAIMLIA